MDIPHGEQEHPGGRNAGRRRESGCATVMRVQDLALGRWSHDPELGIEGKVLRKGAGSVTVKLRRPKPIVIRGQTVGVREYEVKTVAPSWEVHAGRLAERKALKRRLEGGVT